MWLQWEIVCKPSFEFVLDFRNWTVGIYCDYDLTGIDIGPLTFTWFLPDEWFKSFCRSWRIFRVVIRPWKLDIRLEVDANNLRFGYMMAAPWDHSLYCGPLNLQVEYDVMYDEDY